MAESASRNAAFIGSDQVEVQLASVSHLPFKEDGIDLATASEAQYYWPDPVNDLKEIIRVTPAPTGACARACRPSQRPGEGGAIRPTGVSSGSKLIESTGVAQSFKTVASPSPSVCRRMNRRVSGLMAGWRTGLPGPVLILQAGNALNYFGYGLILPFEIIYLHQIRGFSTSTAGLVLAAIQATAAIATPPVGALLDRYSAKAIVVAGSLASALGYAGLAYVDHPWQAFACSIVSGVGIGAAGTANRTLTITLVKPEQRAASVALFRVAGNVGLGSGATVAGLIVASAQRLSSFQALYLFDAVTYAAFALIVLAAVPIARAVTVAATGANRTGFRAVARDQLFLTVIAANVVLFVVGHTFFSNILAPFAKTHTPLGPAAIGIVFLVNTSFVVIAQIPAVRVVARLRRMHAFAAASVLFAVSLLAVLPATLIHSELAATSLLVGVAIVFAMGECVHTVVLGPLVADMAPAHLLGRYISLYGLSFTVSLALGPAIGGFLLQTSPDAVWWGGALAALLAGAVLLRLDGRTPDPLREPPSRLASAPEAS